MTVNTYENLFKIKLGNKFLKKIKNKVYIFSHVVKSNTLTIKITIKALAKGTHQLIQTWPVGFAAAPITGGDVPGPTKALGW